MQPLVSLCALSRVFRQKSGIFGATRLLQAVREVNLELFPGRTLGVVGESGSGKSTLGRMAAGLLPPSSGEVRILGESLYGPRGVVRRPSGGAQMIFQDPYSSFNPRMRVGKAVEEPLLWTGKPLTPQERRRRVEAALAQVGLDSRQA
ncbi:MAG: ATP-binding cassette domain-containing protein, partial [Deltaproteobacteria bacterium]|nr:ATP-binding cassette domain-containing protein [Deltaproteobacteria bacterium]